MTEGVGQLLWDAGWRQGSRFGPLPHPIQFHLDQPLAIPSSARREAQASYAAAAAAAGSAPHRVGQAIRNAKAKDSWILVTQDCDLLKSESIEPNVIAIRCFQTENERMLAPAASNSTYLFLLDSTSGLVADARQMIQLEKPVLLEFEPSNVLISEEIRRRFARWFARRADRPATPDHIVEGFVAPALDLLNRLKSAEPDALDCLERVMEIRFRLVEDPANGADLLFVLEREDIPFAELGLTELVGRLRTELESSSFPLVSWDALSLADISVSDYLATEQLYLDHYTLRGSTMEGLGPPPRI